MCWTCNGHRVLNVDDMYDAIGIDLFKEYNVGPHEMNVISQKEDAVDLLDRAVMRLVREGIKLPSEKAAIEKVWGTVNDVKGPEIQLKDRKEILMYVVNTIRQNILMDEDFAP